MYTIFLVRPTLLQHASCLRLWAKELERRVALDPVVFEIFLSSD
jgi:hypothetical protein